MNVKKTLLALSLFAAAAAAQAQLPPPPSTAAPAPQATSPAKKELIARILRAQQGAIEGMAQQLAERPAFEIMGSAMQVIGARVPKDKQEATARDVQAEAKKYADAATPLVTKHALEIAPSTMGAVLDQQFSEDELKQIAAVLENPTLVKFQRVLPDMQQAMGERLIADMRPQIEPRIKALEDTVAKKLGLPAGGAAPAQGGAKPPAKKTQ